MPRFNWVAYACDLARIAGRESTPGPDWTPAVSISEARLIRRRIARHNRLQETACNRELTARESAEDAGVEARLREFFGAEVVNFNGDPRGQTVKLTPRTPERPGELTYFGRDWGGDLIYLGD